MPDSAPAQTRPRAPGDWWCYATADGPPGAPRGQMCRRPARPGTPPRRPGRGRMRGASGRAPYEIVHSPCIFVTTERSLGTFLVLTVPSRERSQRRDGEHPQLIASILPGPEGRGHAGVAQLFPERAPLIVIQVGWHQGEEGLRGQHDQLAFGP